MRTLLFGLLAAAAGLGPVGWVGATDQLALDGHIEGENVQFTLTLSALSAGKGEVMTLVDGAVAYLGGTLPKAARVQRNGTELQVRFARAGSQDVKVSFASLAVEEGDWRSTTFRIPTATIRKLTMVCDREDLEVRFPGALRVDRRLTDEGVLEVSAFLGAGDTFSVQWKPEVRRLEGELVVSCDANTIATAAVGALRMDTLYDYRIVQGALQTLSFDVPADVQVTRVAGEGILEWRLEETEPRRLTVVLNRPQQSDYRVQVTSERVLPAFPTQFLLPMITPRDVLRTSGFLLAGTDSAIRVRVGKARGLTQVDLDAYPETSGVDDQARARPRGAAFAYQYANLPFALELEADDIVTTLYAEDRLALTLENRDLVLDAVVEVDVRDAPAREIVVETDPGWTIARVEGQGVVDSDVRDVDGVRRIAAVLAEARLGRVLLQIRLERALDDEQNEIRLPMFRVAGAKSERGSLLLRAETGVRLVPSVVEGLREVQPGSLPHRVPGAQQAFRFKAVPWSLVLGLEVTEPAVYAELFHLVSLGPSAVYGSCSITYHVEGAPVRELVLRIPDFARRVELVGRDVRNWRQDGDQWTVVLQEKVIGDYTLLVTYEQPVEPGDPAIEVGGIQTRGTDSETGYIAVAGAARFGVEELGAPDPGMIAIRRSEIPAGYRLLINDPVLKAYKYVQEPHTARLGVRQFPTLPLLGKVADHTTIDTRVSKEGEMITTVTYSVKNTSDQYLEVSLPAGAGLWSVQVDGQDVQALDEGTGRNLLIPLFRHPDPNHPSRVSLVYAQSAGPLGWRSDLALLAPVSGAQSVFARWQVEIPESYALAAAGGSLFSETGRRDTGLWTFADRVLVGAKNLLRRGEEWLVFVFLLWVVIFLGGFLGSTGRRWNLSVPAVLLIGLVGVMAVAVLGRANGRDLANSLAGPTQTLTAERTQSYTRVVSLAGSELGLELGVVPVWVGSSGSTLRALIGVGVGLAWLVVRRRSPWERAAAGTMIFWGLCQVLASLQALYVVFWIGLPVWLCLLGFRWGRAGGRRAADALRWRRDPPPLVHPPEPAGVEGSVSIGALAALAVSALAMASAPVTPPMAPGESSEALSVVDVSTTIEVPPATFDQAPIARVQMTIDVRADAAGWTQLLDDPALVVAGVTLSDPDRMSFTSDGQVHGLQVHRAGRYAVTLDLLAEIREEGGTHRLSLPLPESLTNKTVLKLGEPDLDVVSADAVWLETEAGDQGSTSTLVFRPTSQVVLEWKPRIRRTTLETAVVFGEVHVHAILDAGVVSFANLVRYQISRGELAELNLRIPAGVSVTAVRGEGLGTWRFDPESRHLVAIPKQPVSGAYALSVVTQLAKEGLPYQVAFGVPEILGADRQRGVVAVAARDTVQVDLGETEGLYPMNTADFLRESGLGPVARGNQGTPSTIKRAFRYHAAPVKLAAEAMAVVPEIRVVERVQLDVSDERSVLSSRLDLNILKSGVFSVAVAVPEGFDVESLTGDDVSHWDDMDTEGRRVQVHFRKQVQGERTLNLVLARGARGVEASFSVPRLRIPDASKHTGVLLVTAEPGMRFSTADRIGVSEVNPRDLGVETTGTLAYRLLRPDWSLVLGTDLMEPVVKAEVLHMVDVSQGMLQGTAWIRYTIEHAGVKSFRLRAPTPDVALHVLGRDIAQVRPVADEPGVWRIDLRNKADRAYALEVRFQQPFDATAGEVSVQPLQTLGIGGQNGYLVVRSGGRLQVEVAGRGQGMREENARSIPASFGAGDLSDAILCYRMSREDAGLDLVVTRHQAAEVLPAAVHEVNLTSVVSDDGQMVTRVELSLRVGDLRFLELTLPEGSELWTVFVQDRPVTPLVQGSKVMIPLEDVVDTEARLDLLYAGQGVLGALTRRQRFEGPRLNLPLRDVAWTLYLPSGYRYFDVDGSLEPVAGTLAARVLRFDARRYDVLAKESEAASLRRAEESLRQGEQFAREGRQREARMALETAMYSSQGTGAFNEDARIQFRNLARRQAVVGLVNRRDELKQSQNLGGEAAAQEVAGFQDGNWTLDYGKEVEASLDAKDTDSLHLVAEKILDQQSAAAGEAPAIRVTLPVHGKEVQLTRALQIQPMADMEVSLRRLRIRGGGPLRTVAVALAVLLVLRFAAGGRPGRHVSAS